MNKTHFSILSEANIPGVNEMFSTMGTVRIKPTGPLSAKDIPGNDIILVRSSTKVTPELFRYSTPKIIGSCVTGRDHLDETYLQDQHIPYFTGEGGNARAVVEYVLHGIVHYLVFCSAGQKMNPSDPFSELTIGIIGHGRIGSRLAKVLQNLGCNVLLNDPPLAQANPTLPYVPLEQLHECNIITLHVPMEKKGPFPTYHLINHDYLSQLKPGQLIINACRGGVVDEEAWMYHRNRAHIPYIVDVYENEPAINSQLIKNSFVSTPHIAGHTFDGKLGGVLTVYKQIAAYLDISQTPSFKLEIMQLYNSITPVCVLPKILKQQKSLLHKIHSILSWVYDIRKDDEFMRYSLGHSQDRIPSHFASYRKTYPYRRELHRYELHNVPDEPKLRSILSTMGFQIQDEG